MSIHLQSSRLRAAPSVWIALSAIGVWIVAAAWLLRDCFVDDAFIGFQYLKNLTAGQGFVFFAGETPVEGATNIGWLLALAPLCALVEPTLAAKLAGLVLTLAVLVLTAGLGRRLAQAIEPPDAAFGLVLVPVLMLAASFEFIYFSLAGMETALLALILLAMVRTALCRPVSMWLPVLGAAGFLVHPEAAAVYPLYAGMAWLWASKEERRGLAAGVAIFAALLAGITAVRFFYFGDVLPNTFHAKPSGLALAVGNVYAFLMGQNTNVAFPATGWLAIPLLGFGYWRLRRAIMPAADMLAAVAGVGLAMAVYSPPDWTGMPRYFAPYLPAALVVFWLGLLEAVRRLSQSTERSQRLIAATIAVLLVLTSVVDFRTKMAGMADFPGYVLACKPLIEPTLWVRDHLPADATIATRRIGALAYYSDRRVFDYAYGLPDAEAARLVSRHGGRFNTPTDAQLAELWRARAPDYLLEDGSVIDYIITQAHGVRQRFAIHGIEYRVIEQFPIGRDALWVLAERIPSP